MIRSNTISINNKPSIVIQYLVIQVVIQYLVIQVVFHYLEFK